MSIEESKKYLIDIFGYEYESYIKTHLAGDFACDLVKEFEQKNNKKLQTDGWWCDGCGRYFKNDTKFCKYCLSEDATAEL